MRYFRSGILTCATLAAIAAPFASRAQDSARAVAGGGILVSGWAGKIDAQEVTAGQVLANSKLAGEGSGYRVTTGPAVTYCNTGHWASTDWFVLHELFGRADARLFPGSIVEWTSNASRPVASSRTKWDDLKKKLGFGS